MKTLLVLRHAKSSWKHLDLSDHDRPLNKRGKRDAPNVGKLIKQHKLAPDAILSSTAKRARRTADAVADESGFGGAIDLDRRLYLADTDAIMDVVRELGGSARRLLLVGHNPGLEELVTLLTGRTELFPTAALAELRLSIASWPGLRSSSRARLVNLWRPKELGLPREGLRS